MQRDSVTAALRDVALFRPLPAEDVETLAAQVVLQRHGRNELIFSQGDVGDGLYIVTRGHVSISRQSADGNELILAIYEPGEYLGELALFDEEPRSASAVAVDDVETLFLSRVAFRSFLDTHPAALHSCLQVIVRQLRRCTDLVDEIALLDVRSRLARRLLRLAEQGMVEVGGSDAPGETRRETHSRFRITQQHLANMMGATRESVNKHLNAFVDDGMIRLERGHIRIVDWDRLQACSEGLA